MLSLKIIKIIGIFLFLLKVILFQGSAAITKENLELFKTQNETITNFQSTILNLKGEQNQTKISIEMLEKENYLLVDKLNAVNENLVITI